MTVQVQRGYHFRTPAQFGACLFDRVDTAVRDGIHPIAPYGASPQLYASEPARAAVATRAGEILWLDVAGCLHRVTDCLDEPETFPAPYSMARASRLVSQSSGLWVVAESQTSLLRFDEQTLTHLSTQEIAAARVIDIAGDSYDALFVLLERDRVWQAARIDCAGRIVETVTFEGVTDASAFVFLRHSRRFVVLTRGRYPHLYWFDAKGGVALTSKVVAALNPCFEAAALGCDTRNRVFLAGTDGVTSDGKPWVLVLDSDGELVSEVALDPRDFPVRGVTGGRDSLLVAGARGLLRYSAAQVVPEGMSEVRCSLITPVLHSPDREDHRRWLRIEATANLPEGATLEISYAATDDEALRKKLFAIASDKSQSASERVRKLLCEPGIWHTPIAFHGARSPTGDSAAPKSAPLFDVREPYVWICVTLIATAGGSLPVLDALSVLYPGKTLMEDLPAIYRRAEAQPGSFLRSLVGVLESTTQGLDARIAALGSHAHPLTATGPWLDFVARWLGLPWDDALDETQKRCIVCHASELARRRGTRAGLETLLACLMPGTPRRFRVTDATSDFGFATVGGANCQGSALPALLGGSTPWSTELDSSSVLGRMRLPRVGQVDDAARHIAGRIRVDVAASAKERRAWEPWLVELLEDMVPLTARVTLRWVSVQALHGARLDGSPMLGAAPAPHLGSDAVTGVARLPERGSSITSTGADTGTRLQ